MPEKLRLIDGTFLVLIAVLGLLIALAYARGGGELVQQGLRGGGGLLVRFGLVIVVSFLAAGVAQVVIPHEWVSESLGRDSGFRGIVLGAAAGIITPSGPFVSMPIAVVLLKSGAAAGPVVAYLTGWSVLALHRLIAWEAPILGWRFALFRWSVCLVLPLVAGLLARALARA